MKLFESLFIFVTLSIAAITGYQFSTQLPEPLPQYIFTQNDDFQNQIEIATQNAARDGKKLMVVLGAEWCPDSRILAGNFSTEKMQEIIQRDYETVFVDVGYFENYHRVAQAYDYPAYFGTPTVLIVEPNDNTLMNRTSIKKWLNAGNLSQNEYIEYFSNANAAFDPTAQQPTFLRPEVAEFIATNGQLVIDGFAHLNPIWAAVRNGETDDTSELERVATELWEFRSQAQNDIQKIYKMTLDGNESKIELPSYSQPSWAALPKSS